MENQDEVDAATGAEITDAESVASGVERSRSAFRVVECRRVLPLQRTAIAALSPVFG